MGKGQYLCEVRECTNYSKYYIALLSDEEYSRDMVCATTSDRLFALCEHHALLMWEDVREGFDGRWEWEAVEKPFSEEYPKENKD